MTLATDWPTDAPVSPHQLVSWRQALADLDCSSDTLVRLLAKSGLSIVRMSKRRRAVFAGDLFTLVRARARAASTYAAAKVAHG
jgi:hypothetical protein